MSLLKRNWNGGLAKSFVSLAVVCAVLILSSMGMVVIAADNSDTLAIMDLGQEPMVFTVAELQQFPVVEMTVTSVNASGRENTFSAEGVLLAAVLSSLGFEQAELQALRLVAGDGYAIEVAQDILANRDVLLAYAVDGELLPEDSRPVRAIIPDERAMYWVRNLTTIEVLHNVDTPAVEGIRFLDTIAGHADLVPYEHRGVMDEALAFADLLEAHPVRQEWERLTFHATDGFVKNEAKANVMGAYLKLTGEQAPVFLGPDLPTGMQVRDISFVAVGGDAFVSLAQTETVLGTRTIGEITGVSIPDLLAYVGLVEAAFYEFAAADGYAVQVAAADLAGGLIYMTEDGLRTFFDGLPRNTAVRDLYRVDIVEMEQ